MTTPMTRLPVMPTRSDPANFSSRGDEAMTALPVMVDEFNARLPVIDAAVQAGIDAPAAAAAAAASAASALAAPGTNATSTTSLTVGAGVLSLTIQPNKLIVPGAMLMCARTSDPDNTWMLGQARSYTAATGALVLVVATGDTKGAGTFTDWTLSLSSVRSTVLSPVDLSLVGPSIRASAMFDFSNSRRLDSRFVFTMTSDQTYVDAAGIMRTAPAGVPVFDHDPVTGRCLGWSIWEARTNMLIYSEQFDNASWNKGQLSVTANGAIAPTGVAAMDLLIPDTSNNEHYADQGPVLVAGTTYTYSCFIKAGPAGGYKHYLRVAGLSVAGIYTDPATGTITLTQGANYVSSRIKAYGNGIYRVELTYTAASSGATTIRQQILNALNASTFSGDGTSGVYVWGAVNEVGPFASPYIPTGAAAVTRNAPTLMMLVSLFDFNPAEGTLYAEFDAAYAPSGGSPAAIAEISDGTYNNRYLLYAGYVAGSPNCVVYATTGGVVQALLSTGGFTANTTTRIALAYKANDVSGSQNGAAVISDTSVSLPTVTAVYLGCQGGGAGYLNGHLSKFAYYPRRLTNNELVAMSTL